MFGVVLGEHDQREPAIGQVLDEGLPSLSERWTLRRGASGEEEEVVCVVEAHAGADAR